MTLPAPEPWPVVPFPDSVVSIVIVGSLVLTGLGALTLVLLLLKDKRNRQIW